jgi:hypothetical protein
MQLIVIDDSQTDSYPYGISRDACHMTRPDLWDEPPVNR